MSSPYVTLGDRPLDQWRVTELKEELKKRRLTIKGLKEDLVKRLDEAVRSELEDAEKSDDNSPNDVDQETKDSNDTEKAKDLTDKGIKIIEKIDSNPEDEIDDHRVSFGEGKDVKSDLVQETFTAEPDLGFQVISDSVSVIEQNELKVNVVPDGGESYQFDVEEPHDKKTSTGENGSHENIDSGVPDGGESYPLNVEEPLDKKTLSGEIECPKNIDSGVPDGGESYPLDVEEPLDKKTLSVEIESPKNIDSGVPAGGESYPLDVEEPLDKKTSTDEIESPKNIDSGVPDGGESYPLGVEEPLDKKTSTDGIESPKKIDSGVPSHAEKLSLDDDYMEEDALESKQMETKSDSNESKDGVEKSEMLIVEEEIKPDEMKIGHAENETVGVTSVKRKFDNDTNESIVNNDTGKRARRWNTESLKVSDPQIGNSVDSTTPKDSQPTFKRFSRSDSQVSEGSPKERIVPPSSKPSSNSLRIDQFLRPFTLKAVQELLGKTGNVTSFWMDNIKTHCYVSYSSVEEAVETRNAVYNLQWPTNGGRLLKAEFVDQQEVKSRVESPTAIPSNNSAQPSPRMPIQRRQEQQLLSPSFPPPMAKEKITLPPPPPIPERIEPPIVTLDDLFRKTKSVPRIYFLPLSDEQVAKKLETQGKNV